jgi:hypothetical protein
MHTHTARAQIREERYGRAREEVNKSKAAVIIIYYIKSTRVCIYIFLIHDGKNIYVQDFEVNYDHTNYCRQIACRHDGEKFISTLSLISTVIYFFFSPFCERDSDAHGVCTKLPSLAPVR